VEGPEGWKLIVFEILVFVLLVKAGSYVGDSLTEVRADVLSWVREPTRIVDGETLVALILAFLSWFAFTKALVAWEQLTESPEFWSDAQSGASGLPVPQVRLARMFLGGGVVLLVLTGLIWVGAYAERGWAGLATILDRETGPASVSTWQVVNVLVYFLLGLVMVSQVRLVALRQDWQVRQTGVAGELSAKWWRYSLVSIGLTALVALLLPTGYTQGLLDVLRYGLSVVLHSLYVVVATLFILVSMPFFWLAQLFMGDEIVVPKAPPMASVRPPAPPPSSGGPAWLGLARAVFFWIVLLGFAVYVVRGLLREHPEIRRALAGFRPGRWLVELWKRWWARFALWRATRVQRQGRTGQDREGGEGRGTTFWQRRAPESNRGRVLYYYLDLVRRARRAGFPRRPAQTPLAYSRRLKDELPESQAQVDVVTGAFVEARYSLHSIEVGVVQQVRASWQQIKAYLGGKREDRD
jgi:hypothetical protein